jgi:hypothetical protein
MKCKTQQLITAQDLKDIGFTSESYIQSSIDDIESVFITHINITLQHYYRDKNLTSISNQKLSNATDALLALLTSNEYEANILKSEAMQNLNTDNQNTTSYFDAVAPVPIDTHSKKIQLINKALRKHNQGLFGGGNQMSIESIFHQLETLQKVIKNLSKSDAEFKKLEDKKSKAKLELTLIKDLHVNWKMFTGAKRGLYNTNAYDESISGEFFSLVKLCFEKESQNFADNTIKDKIYTAKL